MKINCNFHQLASNSRWAAVVLVIIGAFVSSAVSARQACSECNENQNQYCGEWNDDSSAWVSGDWQQCNALPPPSQRSDGDNRGHGDHRGDWGRGWHRGPESRRCAAGTFFNGAAVDDSQICCSVGMNVVNGQCQWPANHVFNASSCRDGDIVVNGYCQRPSQPGGICRVGEVWRNSTCVPTP